MAEIQISFANGKIAFVKGNRDITVNKGLEKSIRLNGVMTPIQVVPYGAIKDWNIALVDPVSKEELEKPADDTYVVIDGQHRFLYALRAYNEAIKDEDPSGEHNMITDHISANVIDGARFKSRHPLTLISELNSTSKSWTSANYIASAHSRKNEDELLMVIYLFMSLGFSISTISLFLFFNRKVLTSASLIDYVEGKESFEDANPQRALELYRLLNKVGFSVKFIKKRYLIEMLIKKYNASIIKYNVLIDEISKLDENTVHQIESMNSLDFSSGKHEDAIRKCAKNVISEEKFSININESEEVYKNDMLYLQEEVNAFRISLEEKKNRRRKSPDKSKRDTGDVVNITKNVSIDDVK